MKGFSPTHKWYKTILGKILLFFLVMIAFIGFFFVGLIGYYTFQIGSGNTVGIEEAIRSSRFTFGTELGKPTEQEERIDINTFIRSYTPIQGDADAPVSIVIFIDFECPFCQQSYATTKDVFETYAPVLRIIYKHFPLASIHPLAYKAGEAASCANDQGSFWEYYDILFENRVYSGNALADYAQELGLNMPTFITCQQNRNHQGNLDQDLQDGIAAGVRGTPTYFVNGQKIEGVISREQWDTIIINALDQ